MNNDVKAGYFDLPDLSCLVEYHQKILVYEIKNNEKKYYIIVRYILQYH